MSQIVCVIDGMSEPLFCPEEYPFLATMPYRYHLDTCGDGEPETLRCVLRLLGVKTVPVSLRGYVEALGAGISVAPDDLLVRGSWFALDEQGCCTVPCQGPSGFYDPRFQYHSLGEYQALLRYPHMAHCVSSISTYSPGGSIGRLVETLCPKGNSILSATFEDLRTAEKCMILWGEAIPVSVSPFPYSAAVIAGKTVVKGIAELLKMHWVEVPGATGDVDTDLDAKTEAALIAADQYPFVLLHINGADEAAHRRKLEEKKQFLHAIDKCVLPRLLQSKHTIVVVSDHGTDSQSGLHLKTPQPVFANSKNVEMDTLWKALQQIG